ncbi:MAG: hypothetical protein R3250_01205, partial [Melioribacteraceae bacterium]|nr:hypothetical protein [Melioribacteraceae bacterium]
MKKYLGVGNLIFILIFILIDSFNCNMLNEDIIALFYDPNIPQHEFAANDIKAALEAKNYIVNIKSLDDLSENYKEKKVVITLATDDQVLSLFEAQGGSSINNLSEQAYALRTTTKPLKSYWVFGGDDNGAMYGGLQVAEYINFQGLSEEHNEEESPYLKNRGVKFNIPLDRESPTYYYSTEGTSHKVAIKHVWDMEFWTTWFDEMARHRY